MGQREATFLFRREGDFKEAVITEGRINHIFSDKDGKLENTLGNQNLILELSNNSDNLLGTDIFGVQWFAKKLTNGSQIYSSVNKKGEITGAVVNAEPREFSQEKGLRFKPKR